MNSFAQNAVEQPLLAPDFHALRRVLDVQAVNMLLDESDRAFVAHASVYLDLLVDDHDSEAPLLALEFDGPQHRVSSQRERDERKDHVLRVLLRWRLREAVRDPEFARRCAPELHVVLARLDLAECDDTEDA